MTTLIGDAAQGSQRRSRPTRGSAAIFELKMTLLRMRRSLVEFGRAPPRLARAASRAGFDHIVAQSVTPLWADPSLSERAMQLGKVQNLRRAAAALDGLVLAPGQVFGFWRHVGRATRRRGYVEGRMLREGCMVAAVGGGLCQLSNALYEAALGAGCRIVERHAHSHRVPGSAAALGRDATVAWNYVDLRFAAPRAMQLSVKLGARDLTVSLLARDAAAARGGEAAPLIRAPALRDADSCGSCDQTHCFLHEKGRGALAVGRAGFLVDEAWPEFADYLAAVRKPGDVLGAATLRRWSTEGFDTVQEARLPGALRSLAWRLTPPQGARRRMADARATERIARSLAAQLPTDVTEVAVAQSLLPYLWRAGDLGGRRFSVLMTRLPMAVLQARLDAAFAAHPDRATLADYRADPTLADAEAEALAAADAIITPHAEIAALFGDLAVRLDWRRPKPTPAPRPGDVFAFPGPTVARKGAFELRDAARRLGATIRPLGAELEGPGFWAGVSLDPPSSSDAWLDGVRAVVHPALAEGAPRRLLAALAAGVPVIATEACGLDPQAGLTLIPFGDVEALTAAMAAVVQSSARVTVSG